ncbi:MAG: hypothetical protein EPO21_13145 [Chloroflexota bacterium]|nr:MAG: hypothetical protein EPO21_13145 [Chloroflexota bacterium]
MAVEISPEAMAAARAADSDAKIQLVLLAFGQQLESWDYIASAELIKTRLASGATLWEATESWSNVRSEACALLRRMQAEGIVVQRAEGLDSVNGVTGTSPVDAWPWIAIGLLALLLLRGGSRPWRR